MAEEEAQTYNSSIRNMKSILVAALLTVQLLLVGSARAGADPAGGNIPDREAAAGRQWKEKLGLSADQLPKFLAAVKERDADLRPLREQLRAGMRKLQSQLTDGAPEKDVQATLEQLDGSRKAIALRGEQFDAGMAALLAPSQRAKLLVWKSLAVFPGKPEQGLEVESSQDSPSESEEEPE